MLSRSFVVALAAAALTHTATTQNAAADSTHRVGFRLQVERPNVTRNFRGAFVFDDDSLTGTGKEVLRFNRGLERLNLRFYGKRYTAKSLRGTRAIFVDGELQGLLFGMKHTNGKNYRLSPKDFEAIVSGKRLGVANVGSFVLGQAAQQVAAPPAVNDDQVIASAPTPVAASSGLALLSSLIFARRKRRAA